jgi:hypothetical protein
VDGESDVGVGHAAALIAFADAAIARDDKALAAMADAAAVIAGFDGITRIADATGIPLEPSKAEQTADLRGDLRIDAFVDAKW